MTEKDLALQAEILKKYPFVTVRPGSVDCASFDVPADRALEFARALHDIEGFQAISEVVGCDWGVDANPRFSAVWHVYNYDSHLYLGFNVYAPDNAKPAVPSLCSVWAGCNWHEREAFDLVGITFTDHPDLRRIMMWDEYPYHPLRKDFPLAGIEVPYPDADTVAQTGVRVLPAPMNGGPFLAGEGGTIGETEPHALDQEWCEGNRKPRSDK